MPIRTEQDNYKSTTTLSDQFSKTFSSSVQEVGSTADGFLKSAPTSVGQALNNVSAVAGAFGKIGMSAIGSVSAALGQLGSLGSYTKFKDNFTPPSKLKDLTPEESIRRNKNKFDGQLTYPNNIGEYWVSFTFETYERKIPLASPTSLPSVTINLPIPSNLQEQFTMQYADKQLGIAGFLEKNIPTGINFKDAPEAIGKAVGEAAGTAFKQAGTLQGAYYAGRTVAGLSDSVGSAIDKATGTILNPYQALVFQGINLRSHSFTYRFSPHNSDDNENLRKIIYEFKRRMHPAKDNLLYTFPDTVSISFGKRENEPYFFKKCFLESMSVNYAPQGTPAFFRGTSLPVEVEISLSFKEIEPLTRSDIEEGWRNSPKPGN
jgi:hypothetical protein